MKYSVMLRMLVMGLSVFSSTQAFIYNITILKKWDPSYGRYHYFIGCGDFHDKSHPSTAEQNKFIEAFLLRCAPSDTKILVEDLSSPNCAGGLTCGQYMINSRGGILGGLTQKCEDYGIAAANIEYRYCRVVSLSPALRNLKVDPRTLPSVKNTKLASIASEIDAVMSEIKQYNDGDVLNRYYRNGLKETAVQLSKLKFNTNGHVAVADYLHATTNSSNRLEFIKWLLTFDSNLLDLKMVHEVINARDKKNVIAFAGGSHITRAVDILKKCGYEQIYSSDEEYQREYNLDKCLGSNIVKGKFCVRPNPVDLKILDKYLK